MAGLTRHAGTSVNTPKKEVSKKVEVSKERPLSYLAEDVRVGIGATVEHYFEIKEKEKVLGKDIKLDGAFIKKHFKDNKLTEFESHGIIATVTTAENVGFNMPALLDHFKALSKKGIKVKGLIKRTEYVDAAVLEDAIYNNLLDKEQVAALAGFQETKYTDTLRIKKAK